MKNNIFMDYATWKNELKRDEMKKIIASYKEALETLTIVQLKNLLYMSGKPNITCGLHKKDYIELIQNTFTWPEI
jgi:hypothetical protein